jgi:hypothetical protein
MRFLLKFYLTLLLLASGGLLLLFCTTSFAMLAQHIGQVAAMLRGSEAQRALIPERYEALRLTLAAVALLALGLGLWLKAWRAAAVSAWWAREGKSSWVALGRPWRHMSQMQRGVALGLGVVIVAARLWYGIGTPFRLDETTSYDYSVLPGADVTLSFYPYPNNHVFANLLVGFVHWILPSASPQVALRLLPSLVGLLTLPVVYLLLLRHARMEVVTLGLGLFWLSPEPVFYAIAGRGYGWAMLAAYAGLCATLELLRPATRGPSVHRLAWAVFAGSTIIGLYTVPTHLYTVLALGLALLIGILCELRRRRTIRLVHLTVVSVGVGLVVTVLYSPIGAMSGWGVLLGNSYISPGLWPVYRVFIGPYLMTMATELIGRDQFSTLAFMALLVLVPPVLLLARRLPAPTRRLGWVLYSLMSLWLPITVAQRIAPPSRTLLITLFAFMLLAALLAQVVVLYWPGLRRLRALALPGITLLICLYGGYRLHRQWIIFRSIKQRHTSLQASYNWLRKQHFRRIWVDSDVTRLLWHHAALSAGEVPLPLVLEIDAPTTQPGSVGEVEVISIAALPVSLSPRQPVLFQSEYLFIIPVSPTQPRVFKPE